MFEEAQLYSPVTTGAGGEVTVHLARRPPRRGRPGYRAPPQRDRRGRAGLARRASPRPADRLRRGRAGGLAHRLPRARAAARALRGRASTARRCRASRLPADRVPGLDEVSARLRPLTGLALRPRRRPRRRCASSTASLARPRASTPRSTSATRPLPLYTPEPDIVHEVIGHGHLLATPTFGELHRRAGAAAAGCATRTTCASCRASSGSRSSSASSSRTASCAPTAPGSSPATARSSEFRAMALPPAGPGARWAPPTTTSRTTSRSCTAPSPSARSRTSSAASSTPAPTRSIEELRREHAVA